MKKINLILVIMFLLIGAQAQQLQDYAQTQQKEFPLGEKTLVRISNQFGMVKVENWDKPVLRIEVTIKASSNDKKRADRMLEAVEVSMQEQGDEIVLKTKIGKMPQRNKKENFSVDYVVKLPAKTPMKISNEFGNIAAGKRTGDFEMNLSYGSFALMGLEGNTNKLNIAFSKGNIQYFADADIKLSYSTLNADRAGSMEVYSEFSHVNIKSLTEGNITSSYDEISFGTIAQLTAKGEFSTFKMDELGERFQGTFNYGSVKVKSLSDKFQLCDVSVDFSSLSIENTRQINFRKAEVIIENGGFNYPNRWALKTEKPDYTTTKYTAVDAQAKGQLFRVSAKYSSVKVM